MVGPDGKTFRPENFEQLCKGMGFSRENVDLNLRNFNTLGERYLSEAQELGLKVRDIRKVCKALKNEPKEEKKGLFAALRHAKESGGSEEMRQALDVVCSRLTELKKENEKLSKQTKALDEKEKNLRADYDARGQLLEAQTTKYDELNEKYIRATSPHPSDREAQKLLRNQTSREELDKKCGDALLAVAQLAAHGAAMLADEDLDEDTLGLRPPAHLPGGEGHGRRHTGQWDRYRPCRRVLGGLRRRRRPETERTMTKRRTAWLPSLHPNRPGSWATSHGNWTLPTPARENAAPS